MRARMLRHGSPFGLPVRSTKEQTAGANQEGTLRGVDDGRRATQHGRWEGIVGPRHPTLPGLHRGAHRRADPESRRDRGRPGGHRRRLGDLGCHRHRHRARSRHGAQLHGHLDGRRRHGRLGHGGELERRRSRRDRRRCVHPRRRHRRRPDRRHHRGGAHRCEGKLVDCRHRGCVYDGIRPTRPLRSLRVWTTTGRSRPRPRAPARRRSLSTGPSPTRERSRFPAPSPSASLLRRA